MKHKLNNKGITLVELIVSFAIVAVAVIYFYQMLSSVTRMYSNSRKDLNHAAKVNYAFRLIDKAYEIDKTDEKFLEKCKSIIQGINDTPEDNNDDQECELIPNAGSYNKVTFSIDDKKYILYKYNNSTDVNEEPEEQEEPINEE